MKSTKTQCSTRAETIKRAVFNGLRQDFFEVGLLKKIIYAFIAFTFSMSLAVVVGLLFTQEYKDGFLEFYAWMTSVNAEQALGRIQLGLTRIAWKFLAVSVALGVTMQFFFVVITSAKRANQTV